MSVRFEDYYAVLGVARTATAAEIQSAYRKLARKHHPDVDKTAGATQRFQRVTEAYEVLKDPDTRSRYDALGADWKSGQEFRPPPGWTPNAGGGGGSFRRARGSGRSQGAPDLEGFSDFFEAFFGGHGGFAQSANDADPATAQRTRRAHDDEGRIEIPLALAITGGSTGVGLRDSRGGERQLDVKIPPLTASGTVLRLRGQGASGASDLLIEIAIVPPEGWRIEGDELLAPLRVAPWEAVLGARVPLRLPAGGEAQVAIPPGSSSGRKLRLRGQGLPQKGGTRGDLIAEIQLVVPEKPDDAERALYEDLKRRSSFDPRA